jgi:16S rRNA U1498 N3-methylase RsmE
LFSDGKPQEYIAAVASWGRRPAIAIKKHAVEGSEDELDLTIMVSMVISTPRYELLIQETIELGH